eukprot:698457-Rhodomonas_salina.1
MLRARHAMSGTDLAYGPIAGTAADGSTYYGIKGTSLSTWYRPPPIQDALYQDAKRLYGLHKWAEAK